METISAAWCKVDLLYVHSGRGNDTYGALCRNCATRDPLTELVTPTFIVRHSVVAHRQPDPRRCDICRREITVFRKFYHCQKCREYLNHFLSTAAPGKLEELCDLDETVSIPIRQIRASVNPNEGYVVDLSN